MPGITLTLADQLIHHALACGHEQGTAPLTVAVLDDGGHLVALKRQDGASLLRPQIALGKAWGAIALGKPSAALASDAAQRPPFYAALAGFGPVVPAAGGVLVRDGAGRVIGAVGISGDASEVDERCALLAVERSGFAAQ